MSHIDIGTEAVEARPCSTNNKMATPEISTQEPSVKVTSNPEPLPEWHTAFTKWNSWWEVHNFSFGILYVIVAVFCVYCLVRLKFTSQSLTLTRYFTVVTGLLLMFAATRTLYFLLDPYESHKYLTLPDVLNRIIFALGYPCMTCIFSLINFTFLKVNNMFLIVKRLQDIKFLSSIIIIHFIVVLVIYLVVTFSPRLARLFIVCQVILIIWWLAIDIAFIYSAGIVKANEKSKEKYINTNSVTVEEGQAAASHSTTSKGTKRILNISGIVAVAGLASVGLEFYSLFGVYDLYNLKKNYVEAWPWLGYQTANRCIEIILCAIIAYIIYPTTKTVRRNRSETANTASSVTQGNRKISKHQLETVESQL